MSIPKPSVFAPACKVLGAEEVRAKLGVDGTGLPFNSPAAVERGRDGRTNPMVNSQLTPLTVRDHGRKPLVKRLVLSRHTQLRLASFVAVRDAVD